MPVIVDIYQSMIKGIKNQVLRKHVKLHNLVNVNIPRYINVSRHSQGFPYGCFFRDFLKSLPQNLPYFYLITSESLKQILQQPLE